MKHIYGSTTPADAVDLDFTDVRSRITSLSTVSLDLSSDLLSVLAPMPEPAKLEFVPNDGLVANANVPAELVQLTRAVELADQVVLELAKTMPVPDTETF